MSEDVHPQLTLVGYSGVCSRVLPPGGHSRPPRSLPHDLNDVLAPARAGVELEEHDLLPLAEQQPAARQTGP